ncbi:MAG: hypothetical protein IT435_15975 [Phycisphaerales bacterium]|nr:hypothetical protein [Phycisphaerales bacterium]
MSYTYPFTECEAKAAAESWGCNCGPSALAFACQVGLDAARHAISGFDEKRYTSPTMMKGALEFLGRAWTNEKFCKGETEDGLYLREHLAMFTHKIALVRVQWGGPWTEPGANPRWAYGHTHWIATWSERDVPLIFDVNGGIRSFVSWQDEIAPVLMGMSPRRSGKWWPTHIWRLV